MLALAVLLLVACGTKKNVAEGPTAPDTPSGTAENVAETAKTSFARLVNANSVATDNIVASMSFSLKTGSKNLSAPGTLRMRKDQVIRMQVNVPILGSEVGRIDFTPDYVMLVDRLHKEYIKTSYAELSFLRDNGIDFYALQSLFWNQLHVPGKKAVTAKDLKALQVDLTSSTISLKDGKMAYVWATDDNTRHISKTEVSYQGTKGGTSTLQWQYADFRAFEGKSYPVRHQIHFATDATTKPRQIDVTLQLSGLSDNSKWDVETTLSGKYKQMDAESLLRKILNMGI